MSTRFDFGSTVGSLIDQEKSVVAGIGDAGWSGIIDPDYRFHGSASRSTLPPVRMIPTRFPPTSITRSRIAAYGTAADGSMTIFIVSQIARIAKTIASSLTVTMSST